MRGDGDARRGARVSVEASSPPPAHKRGTLVIVDDSASMRRSLEILIGGEEVFERVLAVGDPFEALRLVREQPVDLVLCDLHLQGTDGLKFAQVLAGLPLAHRPPLVLITGYAVPASTPNVAAVLPKPVAPDVLLRALHTHRRVRP